jgi:hypothetical protein|uniref:Uncharacterized protein n=1 Tax=Mus musculus TaxID=10090 RepID=Q8C9G1_MOUSE|nr:unnamed protein product [Mus musculus]
MVSHKLVNFRVFSNSTKINVRFWYRLLSIFIIHRPPLHCLSMFELEYSSTVSFNVFCFPSADGVCVSDSGRIFKTLIFVIFLILVFLGHGHTNKYLLKLENSAWVSPTIMWLIFVDTC